MSAPMKMAGRGRPKKMSNATTLKSVGISRDQASRWKKIASIPEALFEATLADKTKPHSTARFVRLAESIVESTEEST